MRRRRTFALSLCAVLACAVREGREGIDIGEAALTPAKFQEERARSDSKTTDHQRALEEPWTLTENLRYEEVQAELLKNLTPVVDQDIDPSFPKFKRKQELREVIEILRNLNQSNRLPPSGCQLGGLLAQLTWECEQAEPQNVWIRHQGTSFEHEENPFRLSSLPNKTCRESAADIFLYGRDLVQALQVPAEAIHDLMVPAETLPLVQSLWFLQKWLVHMATAQSAAILWAGFWTDPDDPKGADSRTSKQKLFEFARLTDHQTVHPATLLGRTIEEHGDLNRCYRDESENELAQNMWSLVSMFFVIGMQQKEQRAWALFLSSSSSCGGSGASPF